MAFIEGVGILGARSHEKYDDALPYDDGGLGPDGHYSLRADKVDAPLMDAVAGSPPTITEAEHVRAAANAAQFALEMDPNEEFQRQMGIIESGPSANQSGEVQRG